MAYRKLASFGSRRDFKLKGKYQFVNRMEFKHRCLYLPNMLAIAPLAIFDCVIFLHLDKFNSFPLWVLSHRNDVPHT